jgi:hypothetical protein
MRVKMTRFCQPTTCRKAQQRLVFGSAHSLRRQSGETAIEPRWLRREQRRRLGTHLERTEFVISIRSSFDLAAIRERADEIRRDWTRPERLRRQGLPPDIPSAMRHFLGSDQSWSARPALPSLRTSPQFPSKVFAACSGSRQIV